MGEWKGSSANLAVQCCQSRSASGGDRKCIMQVLDVRKMVSCDDTQDEERGEHRDALNEPPSLPPPTVTAAVGC